MSKREASLSEVLASRLLATRRERALTQLEVAHRLGWDIKRYGSIERGDRGINLTTLERLATALQVPAWELLRPLGAIGESALPQADRFAALLERADARQREAVLRVLESFAPYRARPRPTRRRRVGPGR